MSPLLQNLIHGAGSISLVQTGSYDTKSLMSSWQRTADKQGQSLSLTFMARTSKQRLVGCIGMFATYLLALGGAVALAPSNEPLAACMGVFPGIAMLTMTWLRGKL